MKLVVVVIGLLLLTACSSAVPSPTLTGDQLAASLQTSDLPVDRIDIATEATDVNHLLGRPNQYVAKINWHDTRIENAENMDATVEVFATAADLESRFKYTDALSKGAPTFAQYIYRNDAKRVLLRLPHDLTPTQAEEYQRWLTTL